MLTVNVLSYARAVYDGTRPYSFPLPLVIGSSGVGRIASIGPDTTSFTPGQLVLVDCFIKGRDDPTAAFLMGIHEGHTEASMKLMRGEWRDSTYAEYAKIPLENAYALDEKRLLGSKAEGGLELRLEDLCGLTRLAVPFGGLSGIGIKPGDTVIVAPATGPFGGAAVVAALALGARVIAMGRNIEALERIKRSHERVEKVQITGNMAADLESLQKFGKIDGYFDISPPEAKDSTHLKSAILALRHGGRVSLMGGMRADLGIPYSAVMYKDLTLKGKWMYNRDNVRDLIKMVEVGVLKLGGSEIHGQKEVRRFSLEDWDEAFTAAEESSGKGGNALIEP